MGSDILDFFYPTMPKPEENRGRSVLRKYNGR
jgi:hypothetical protein